MVYLHFPPSLTEEEELLRQRYAKLRKKKKLLQAYRAAAAKPEREQPKEQPVKRPAESAEDAKEQAKKLLKSGAIKIEDKMAEKRSFKRSRNLEKKLSDPEKTPTPAAVGFQPFSAVHPDDERDDRERERDREQRPRQRGRLYDSFVRGDRDRDRDRDGRDRDRHDQRYDRDDIRDRRDDRREREPLPKKGNTIYVYGHGITEEILRKAFSKIGEIINITMETDRHCGFVTFEKMEHADLAISEVNGGMIDGVQLKVSMARRQPNFEQVADPSTSSWASIASSHSQKGGGHKDKREMVAYEEDIF